LKDTHDEFYNEVETVRLAEICKKDEASQAEIEKAKNERLERALKQVKWIEENEVEGLQENTQNVRPYLTSMLEPVLTDGLLQVTDIIPNDPIEY